MQKRQFLKNTQSIQQHYQCIICQFTKVYSSSIFQLPQKIIASKYYEQRSKLLDSAIIKELIRPRQSTHFNILYRQSLEQSKQVEMIQTYHSFQTIVTSIKPIILKRSTQDKYSTLHFNGPIFRMMLHRYLSHKLAARGKSKQKILKSNGSASSADSERKPVTQPVKLVKSKQQLPKESETFEIRRLTRNLSSMVRKFQQNFQFHPSIVFQLMDFVPGHVFEMTRLQQQHFFERQLEDNNISIIQDQKNLQRLKTVDCPCQCAESNYGFKPRYKVAESRKLKVGSKEYTKPLSNSRTDLYALKENISPNQRIQTQYNSSKIKTNKKSISSKKSDKNLKSTLGSLRKSKDNIKTGSTSKSRMLKR